MKLVFFIKRALGDIFRPFRFYVSPGYLKDSRYPYGLDYSSEGMQDYYKLQKDKDGVILMPHYIDHKSSEKYYYSPVKIAHYALGAYNDYLKTKKQKYIQRFKKHIKFLENNWQQIDVMGKSAIVWTTPSTNARYGVQMNYISAIVQGLVISAFCRAFLHYNETKYKELAISALDIFSIPLEKGGILAKSIWGDFYEEYPSIPYSHVVNGFIFSLIGLHDCWKICQCEKAMELYKNGIQTLKKVLPVWYTPKWAKYDLRDFTNNERPNLATYHYHCLHADLLKIIWLQTNDTLIKKFVDITESQLKNKKQLLFVYFNKFLSLILKV